MIGYFVSDIHLKEPNERNSQTLLRFLHSVIQEQKNKSEDLHVFFLGDIFDLWFGGSDFFLKKWKDFVWCLDELVKLKAKVYYIEGNHDLHIVDFWKKRKIQAFVEARYFELDTSYNEKLILRVEHGDLINHEDKAYLRYRGFIRHPIIEKVGKFLPGAFLQKLGDQASSTSRKHSSVYRANKETQLRNYIHQHAKKCFVQKKFHFLISGHMHVQDDYIVQHLDGGRTARSINLGSWFDGPKVLKLQDFQYSWVQLD